MSTNITRRYVSSYNNITITDDFGSYMHVGDTVEIHVMPFDYKVRGKLIFNEEECAYFVDCKYGKHTLSHRDEYRDMGATILITKTFKYIANDSRGDCNV